MIIIKVFLSKKCLTRLNWPNRDIHEDAVETICSLNAKLASSITPRSLSAVTGSSSFPKREAKVSYLRSHLSAAKHDKFCFLWVK